MSKLLFLVALFSVFMFSCSGEEDTQSNKCENVTCSVKGVLKKVKEM